MLAVNGYGNRLGTRIHVIESLCHFGLNVICRETGESQKANIELPTSNIQHRSKSAASEWRQTNYLAENQMAHREFEKSGGKGSLGERSKLLRIAEERHGAVMVKDSGADGVATFGMDVGGQGAGPGDIAMAGGIEGVAAFIEHPARAGVKFAQGEVIGGDVLVSMGKPLFGNGELVHEGESEVLFFGGEVYFEETTAEFAGGFPADLASEAGFITGALDVAELLHEVEEDGFEEVPVFGAAGEEGAEPKALAGGHLVDVDDGEVALAGGRDVETEPEFNVVSGVLIFDWGEGFAFEDFFEVVVEVVVDFGFALVFEAWIEFAEVLEDLFGFEVDAFDFIIEAATFDGGPFDDAGSGGAERITEVGLLEDFVGAGTGLAIGEELFGGELGSTGAVDDVKEAEFEGVGHGDTEVEVPRRGGGIFDF